MSRGFQLKKKENAITYKKSRKFQFRRKKDKLNIEISRKFYMWPRLKTEDRKRKVHSHLWRCEILMGGHLYGLHNQSPLRSARSWYAASANKAADPDALAVGKLSLIHISEPTRPY